jgi:hypothetical protein
VYMDKLIGTLNVLFARELITVIISFQSYLVLRVNWSHNAGR